MRWWVGVAMLLGTTAPACRSPEGTGSPYQPPVESARNTVRAEELSREAARLIGSDPGHAEQLLRQALAADLFYDPAHNNLGVVYLERGMLYEAANEFEWARKLMAGHPDPRVNLAITLDRAGRGDEAVAAFESALQVQPGYLPAVQGVALLTVKAGRDDERLEGWLEEIAMRANGSWDTWARAERVGLHASSRKVKNR